MILDSVDLTHEVADRLDAIPSHTVVPLHVIVKDVLAVLVERGFIAYETEEATHE